MQISSSTCLYSETIPVSEQVPNSVLRCSADHNAICHRPVECQAAFLDLYDQVACDLVDHGHFAVHHKTKLCQMQAVFISPLIWVVVCSFSPQPGSAQSKGWGVNNYLTLFGYQEGLPKYLFNSVVVTLVAVVFSVVVCTLAGYSFSRFDYPGRNLGFMVTLSILMVPYASLLIPLMVWYKDIGLNDSLLGVGLVITLFQLPMSTFIMRNAFDAIPKDMEEAAMVDGCNSLQSLIKILVPVVKPSMVTVGLLAFLEAWNNFMIPLYLSSSSNATLPLALVNMRQQTMGVIDYGATEAGVVILMIPAAILFLALQKYYVKGFMAGAVKG